MLRGFGEKGGFLKEIVDFRWAADEMRDRWPSAPAFFRDERDWGAWKRAAVGWSRNGGGGLSLRP